VRLEPIPDEPAIIVDSKIMVIADLHIGIEAEFKLAGIFIPSQSSKMAQKIERLIDQTGIKELVILGDVKHFIPGTVALERRDIPLFFNTILEVADEVHVVAGNHDAMIRPHVPKKVKFHRPEGFKVNDIGFIHGHAWPSQNLMKSRYLLMGHNHPAVVLVDELGGRNLQPCWVRYEFRKIVKNRKHLPREGLLVPSFNDLCGGAAVNDKNSRFLGPLVNETVANLSFANIHLLDGTYLGHLKDLIVDSGPKMRDFRQ